MSVCDDAIVCGDMSVCDDTSVCDDMSALVTSHRGTERLRAFSAFRFKFWVALLQHDSVTEWLR